MPESETFTANFTVAVFRTVIQLYWQKHEKKGQLFRFNH